MKRKHQEQIVDTSDLSESTDNGNDTILFVKCNLRSWKG